MPKWFLVGVFGAFLTGAVAAVTAAMVAVSQSAVNDARQEERGRTFAAAVDELKDEVKGLKTDIKSLTSDRWTRSQEIQARNDLRAELAALEARLNARIERELRK